MWAEAYQRACSDCDCAPREEVLSMQSGSIHLPGNVFERFKNRISDTDLKAILQAGSECLTLSELSLPYNSITSEGGKFIADALNGGLDTLMRLDVSFNSIEGDAAAAMAEALAANQCVSDLRMCGNPLGTSCGAAFHAMLSANRFLTRLDLYSTDLDMKALVLICEALALNTGLQSLNLGKPLLPNPDDVNYVVHHLALGLRDNTTLVDLTLSYFGLYDYHIQTLLPVLCTSSIVSLCLKANKLAQDSGVYLARLLERKQDFRVLDLSSNRIGDVGAIALSKSMRSHSELHSLMLQSNSIGDDGIAAIAEGVRGCRSLRSLDLWGNELQRHICIGHLHRIQDYLEKLDHVDFKLYLVDGQPAIYRTQP